MSLEAIPLWSRGKPAPVLQSEAAECGLACLANIAGAYGLEIDLLSLRRQFSLSIKGMSLTTMLRVAQDLGLNGRALKVELDDLPNVRMPAVLHWDLNHFVVLEQVTGSRSRPVFHILDPASGRSRITSSAVSASFTGIVAEFEPTASFEKGSFRKPLRIRDLWTEGRGLYGAMIQLALAAIVSQSFLVLGPLYMQVAIDTALPTADQHLLFSLGAGFFIIACLAGVTIWLRGALMISLGQSLSYQIGVNLTRHLFRLPLAWFEKRQVADLISRLASSLPISDFISKQAFSVIVSCGSLLIYSVILAYYSLLFLFLLLGTISLYGLLKLVLIAAYNRRNQEAIRAQARESGMMIENLRAMSGIKASGTEGQMLALWTNRKAFAVSASVRLAQVQNVMDAALPTILAMENVVFVLICVLAVLSGKLTLGMAFAATLYKQQAMTAGTSFVDLLSSYKGLEVHLERISEIALEPAEPAPPIGYDQPPVIGQVSLRDIHFAYGIGEPPILRGATMHVGAGETVAITGRSGTGKSTLLRIILGLLEPSRGLVQVDETDLQKFGGRAWRSQVGYVAQADELFQGSLAENIAFFDADLDMTRVALAARQAVIYDDIMQMPMRFETLVGDMGSSLSGGQKARILIARALYRAPRVLLVDEGSAHLDVETEAELNTSIRSLGITRVIVSHRPETIACSDRVYTLSDGLLLEAGGRPS